MKSFEGLFSELQNKVKAQDQNSGTVRAINAGKHTIGKKLVEEAAEVWMASEYEGREKTAEEISQLIYRKEQKIYSKRNMQRFLTVIKYLIKGIK